MRGVIWRSIKDNVEVERRLLDVHEHRDRILEQHAIGRRHEAEGRRNHLIPAADAERFHRQMERGRSAAGGGGKARAHVVGKGGLEFRQLWAEAEERCPQHVDHRLDVRLGNIGTAQRNLGVRVQVACVLRVEWWALESDEAMSCGRKLGERRVGDLNELQGGAFGRRGLILERDADANQRGVTSTFGQGVDHEVNTPEILVGDNPAASLLIPIDDDLLVDAVADGVTIRREGIVRCDVDGRRIAARDEPPVSRQTILGGVQHRAMLLRSIEAHVQVHGGRAVAVQLGHVVGDAKLVLDAFGEAQVLAAPLAQGLRKSGKWLTQRDRFPMAHGAHRPGGHQQHRADDKHPSGHSSHFAETRKRSSRLTPRSSTAATMNTDQPPAV